MYSDNSAHFLKGRGNYQVCTKRYFCDHDAITVLCRNKTGISRDVISILISRTGLTHYYCQNNEKKNQNCHRLNVWKKLMKLGKCFNATSSKRRKTYTARNGN